MMAGHGPLPCVIGMKFAAFLRNVNLGRPHCPSKAQFETAFLQAGAGSAASFLTNGTLVFEAGNTALANQVLQQALALLAQQCGLREPAFLRSLAQLARQVQREPFGGVKPGSVYACCISFLAPRRAGYAIAPLASSRGDVQLLDCFGADVFSVCHKLGNTIGSPNALVEKTLGLPASTRNWNTVLRLLDKHG
jgi:uncharacterized protein (DUF1697 family)